MYKYRENITLGNMNTIFVCLQFKFFSFCQSSLFLFIVKKPFEQHSVTC